MDLRRQIAIVRARLPLLVAAVVLAAAGAYLVSSLQQRTYEARATLIVGQSLSAANIDYTQLLVSQRLSMTYAAVATTRPILDAVISELRMDVTSDNLVGRVRADAPAESTLLKISAQDPDPARAAAIANTLAEKLIAASPAIQGREATFQAFVDAELAATQRQIETTQARLETLGRLEVRPPEQDAELQTLEGRLAGLRSTYATLLSYSSGNVSSLLTVIEPAVPPAEPASPRLLLNTLLGAVLGLLVALAIAFGVDYLDDSIKDADTVEEVAGLSTLGAIARMNGTKRGKEAYRLAPLLYPRSGAAEAYRGLRTNVEFTSVDAPIRTLLVTSAIPGEGKTITACNVAIVFAQAGHRVLLVDADLRKPGVHQVFELPNAHGLTTLLRSDDATVDAVAQSTELENLRILTTGPLPPNPAELTGSQRMRTVVDLLKGNADLVVLDSAPLQAVTDSAILSSLVDATLVVIDAERSHRRTVRLAREALARADANVVGAVLNRVAPRGESQYGKYYGGYVQPEGALEGHLRAPEEPAGRSVG